MMLMLMNKELGETLTNLLEAAAGSEHGNQHCVEVNGRDWHCWQVLLGMGLARAGSVINDGKYQYFHAVDPRPWRRYY